MSRRNNVKDMTICEQLEAIKEDFCHLYCKYYQTCKDQVDAIKGQDKKMRAEIIDVFETELGEHCDECPLTRL